MSVFNPPYITPFRPDQRVLPPTYLFASAQVNANTCDLLVAGAYFSAPAVVPPSVVYDGEVPPPDRDAWLAWSGPLQNKYNIVNKDGALLDNAGRLFAPTFDPPGPATLDYSLGYAILETVQAGDEKEFSFPLTGGAGTYEFVPFTSEGNQQMTVEIEQGEDPIEGPEYELDDGSVTIILTAANAGQIGGVFIKRSDPAK